MRRYLPMALVMVAGLMFAQTANATEGQDGHKKVKICHNAHTIEVDWHAAWAHTKHGDTWGECKPDAQPPKVPCPEPEPEPEPIPGPAGPQGPQGPAGESTQTVVIQEVAAPEQPTCVGDRVAKDTILSRGKVRNLKAWFEGKRLKLKRVRTPDPAPSSKGRKLHKWTISVDLRGLERGTYVVRVRYVKGGRKRTAVHYHRVCYGNPRGGYGEGMNASTRIHL